MQGLSQLPFSSSSFYRARLLNDVCATEMYTADFVFLQSKLEPVPQEVRALLQIRWHGAVYISSHHNLSLPGGKLNMTAGEGLWKASGGEVLISGGHAEEAGGTVKIQGGRGRVGGEAHLVGGLSENEEGGDVSEWRQRQPQTCLA